MPSSVNLGTALEAAVNALVRTGRYGSRSEVLREGVRLVHDREARLAALQAAVGRGVADAEAGRVHDADEAFDELEAYFRKLGGPSPK